MQWKQMNSEGPPVIRLEFLPPLWWRWEEEGGGEEGGGSPQKGGGAPGGKGAEQQVEQRIMKLSFKKMFY